MPTDISVGQAWSVWEPSRRQWLLASVTRREAGMATLQFDPRYKIGRGYETQAASEHDMMTSPRLFRFIEPKA